MSDKKGNAGLSSLWIRLRPLVPIFWIVYIVSRCYPSPQSSPPQQPTIQYVPVPYKDPAKDSIDNLFNQPSPQYFPPSPNTNTIQLNPPSQQMNCTQQWIGNQWVTKCY